MSLYNAITEIKGVFEADVFKPASKEELAQRTAGATKCEGCGKSVGDPQDQLQCDGCGGTFCADCAMEYKNGTVCVDCAGEMEESISEKDIFQAASKEEVAKRQENMVSDADVIQLEEQILDIARNEADDIYRQLEKQYDYIMSDEGIAEDLRANEREFDVDPETGLLDEAKQNVFKAASKKDVVAREAKAKADRIKSGRVYFDDLTDEDKATIIKRYQEDGDYPGYDWWDGDIGTSYRGKDGLTHRSQGYFDEELAKKGFLDTEIHFSGFYSQGDGASFECRLDVKQIVKHYKIKLRPIVLTAVNNNTFYGKITTSGNYSHSHTMEINLEYEGDANESRVNEAEENVFKPANSKELKVRKEEYTKSLPKTYEEWGQREGLSPQMARIFGEYMNRRWEDRELNTSYGEEWLDRFKEGSAYADSDNAGREVLKDLGVTGEPNDRGYIVDVYEAKDVFKPASQEELEQRPGWKEAQEEERRWAEEQEERRRRIEQRHLTQPDSRSLIKQWVSGDRIKGRAASLSVKGDVLFSYATPIAIRADDQHGWSHIYMVDQKFSVTTSKQQSYVRREAANYTEIPVHQFKQMLDDRHIDYGYSRLHEDVFKSASKEELAKRQSAWMQTLAKKGVKINYIEKPQPNRLGSFWYDGQVAEVTFTAPDGESRLMSVEAHGDIRVTFVGSDTRYDGWNAVEEAMDRGYTDEDLGDADYEEPAGVYHGKVTDWDMNNWFEFMYGSSKWEGQQDIMGDTYGSYDEALDVAVEIITDDELWHDLTNQLLGESKVIEKDVFKPASTKELNKRLGANKDYVWVIRDRQGAGMHEEEFFSSPEAIRQHLASYHSVDWEGENDDGTVTDIETMDLPFLLDYGGWDIDKVARKDLPVDAEILNEAEDVFQPAGEDELKARGSLKYLPKSGHFEYKFLKHIDNADPDAKSWKIVGMGTYFDYENSDIYLYDDGEPEFNIYYNTEIVVNDNMEFNSKLTEEVQAFEGTEEEWVASKLGWKKEYSGYTGNEDPAYFWGYGDFSYVSFGAKEEDILGGAVITFRGDKPKVYLGDLEDVFTALNQPDPKQDIADMFGYDHYDNLVYDIKKYCGTLTEEEEEKHKTQPQEPVHGQLNWTFGTKNGGAEYYAESKVNEEEENVFKPATREEMKQRTAEFDRLEKERKAKASAALKAYYAGIPYTYEDIIQLPIYKKILELKGVEDVTTHLQKSHKSMTFHLKYVDRRDPSFAMWAKHLNTGAVDKKALSIVPYYVYANGYIRSASFYGSVGDQRVIHKYEPAQTLEAYGQLLEELYKVIVRRMEKEARKIPFDPHYDCSVCADEAELDRSADWYPHSYGTRLGNKHLKDQRNSEELNRLKELARKAGTELEL